MFDFEQRFPGMDNSTAAPVRQSLQNQSIPARFELDTGLH
jgi:hypothetical protein